MIFFLLLILTPPETSSACFIQIAKLRHEAKMSKFRRWLDSQKNIDALIKENQKLIEQVKKIMGEK